jgi:hypothetical protein
MCFEHHPEQHEMLSASRVAAFHAVHLISLIPLFTYICGSRRFIRHDDGAGGSEHAADAVTTGSGRRGIWARAVPRIWRTLFL